MKRNSIPAILLVLLLTIGLAGCQSSAAIDEAVTESIVEPAQTETAVAEEAGEAEDIADEVPVTVSYTYQGYTIEAVSYDGYAEVSYPSVVTADDISAFLAAEAAKYGNQVAGVYYKVNDGVLELTYPEGIAAGTRKDLLYTFCEDISAKIVDLFSLDASTFTPVIVDPPIYGYDVTISVYEDVVIIDYPTAITETDILGFLNYVNEKYGSYLNGAYYTITEGQTTITIPDGVDPNVVAAYIPLFFEEAEAYAGTILGVTEEEEVVVEEVAEEVVEEAVEEETVEAVAEPAVVSKTLYGYTVTVSVLDGVAVVEYPSIVTQSDAAGFYAYEVAKYGSYIDGITYTLADGVTTLNIPLADEVIVANADVFFDDIVEYVTVLLTPVAEEAVEEAVVEEIVEEVVVEEVAEEVVEEAVEEETVEATAEPAVVSKTLYGYTVTVSVLDGVAVVEYPSIVTQSDAAGFYAYEVAKYGSYIDGITYTLADGVTTLNIPLADEVIVANADVFFDDIVEYVTVLLTPVAEEAVEEEVVVEEVAEEVVEEAVEEETVEAVAEPAVVSKTLYGYTVTVSVLDGVAVVEYPSIVTQSDAAGFYAYEVAKYGSYIDGIYYTLADGSSTLYVPLADEVIVANADVFFDDIVEYVTVLLTSVAEEAVEEVVVEEAVVEEAVVVEEAIVGVVVEAAAEPAVVSKTLYGYTVTVSVLDGVAVVEYPSIVTQSDAAGFYAYEVAKYGSYIDGIYYTLADGSSTLYVPLADEVIVANADVFFDDIVEYVTALLTPVAEEAVEEVVVEEAVVEEAVVVEEAIVGVVVEAVAEPAVVSKTLYGYTVTVSVLDGVAVVEYPSIVTQSDAAGFYAYEVAKYGSYIDGIYYTLADGSSTLYVPLADEVIVANADVFFDDIVEYVTVLLTPVAEEAVEEEVVVEEVVEEVAEEVVEAVAELAVVSKTLYGYTVTVSVLDGVAVVEYPSIVTQSDAAGFYAYEVAKYGSYIDGIYYTLADGSSTLYVPLADEVIVANTDVFFDDIVEYVTVLLTPVAEEAVEEEVVVEEVVVEEVAEEVVEAVAEPAVVSKTLYGYTVTVSVLDGVAVVEYPSIVTQSDAAGFYAYEVAKYGSYIDGIYYTLADGSSTLYVPLADEVIVANADVFFDDIVEYVTVLLTPVAEEAVEEVVVEEAVEEVVEEVAAYEPIVLTESVYGYVLTITVNEETVVIEYPAVVTQDDAAGFFAYEVDKYGTAYLAGVYYVLEDGSATLTIPEAVTTEAVVSYAPVLVDDIVEYVTVLLTPVAEEAVEEVVVEEAVEEVAEAVAEPAVVSKTLYGYTVTVSVLDGVAVVEYPSIVTQDDAAGFYAYEVAKYGSYIDGIYYTLADGSSTLYVPLADEVIVANTDVFFDDIVEYVTVLLTPVAEEAVEEVVVEEAVEEVVEAVAELAVVSKTLYGYTVTVSVLDGVAVVEYPSIVTQSDAAGFYAYEVAKYGSYIDGIYYTLADGSSTLYVPLADEVIVANADVFFDDIVEYVTVLLTPVAEEAVEEVVVEEAAAVAEPAVVSKTLYGYTVTVSVLDGVAVVEYPSIVTQDDAAGFYAYEVAKYGSYIDGIYYTLADGSSTLYVPLADEVIVANTDVFFDDIVEYVTVLLTPVAEEAVEEVVVEETVEETVVEEGPVVYPLGIEPIVKNSQGDDEFDLFILHTNDVHGRIVEGTDGSIGYSKFSTLLKTARSLTDNILLLDAGDTLHGTNLANMFEGSSVVDLMEELGYDAFAPGNHDFNYGADRLSELASDSAFKVLSANITDETGSFVFQPYQIYDYNGYKVAVIGLTTPDTKTKAHPARTVGLDFMSDSVCENFQSYLDLAHEYADFVVILGHLGIVPDGETGVTSVLAAQNLNGIDLFIDAHSHSVMDGGEVVNGTLITSTGQYLNNIGVVQVHVKDGVGSIAAAYLIPASDIADPSSSAVLTSYGITSIPSDPVIDNYVEEKNEELNAVLDKIIANIPMNLDGERQNVRTKRTNLAKLICDAMTAESGADFTIINGGGIRSSLKAGPVTLGDVNDVLPFTNIITVCEITPAEIYAALELGYSMLPETNGGYSQTDLKVVYSAKAAPGDRIKRVYLGKTLLDKNDTTTVYKVATNDFMAAGGDGYTMFGRVLSEGSMLNEVFASYLQKLYPVRR